jgi:predicted transcriptional regulator
LNETAYLTGFVLASTYRRKVLLALKDKALTPNIISERTSIYPTHVSTSLTELSKKNLVVCLTPKLKKGRLYGLTKKGHEILDQL